MGQNIGSKHLLFDPLPKAIVWDTNFIVHCLDQSPDESIKDAACQMFLLRLFLSQTVIYVSALIFPEFWQAVLKRSIQRKYSLDDNLETSKRLFGNKKQYMKEFWDDVLKLQRKFDKLLANLNIKVIETDKAISLEAEKHARKYSLLSFDALHLATMTTATQGKPAILDIVTFDRDIIDSCSTDYNVWHKGCAQGSINKYRESLKPEEIKLLKQVGNWVE